jgi:PEP-CTERM motif
MHFTLFLGRAASIALTVTAAVTAAALAAFAPAAAFAHEIVVNVGRSAAGQIKIDADLHHPIPLPVSVFPGISGFAEAEPAFHSTILDDPANDFLQFDPAANFQFVITAQDPGIGIYTPSGPVPLNTPVTLGPSVFDFHPVWNIPGGAVGATYNITLKIQDTTGMYTESAPLIVPFQAVPEPSTLALIAIAPLILRRRRQLSATPD